MRLLDEKLIRLDGDQWNIIAQKCDDCGRIAFPRKRVCPNCFGSNLAEYHLSKHGSLHTYTTTYLGSPSLSSPYTMGFVDLPEGIKLMGIIQVAEPAEQHLEVGMEMDIVLDKLRQDPDGEDVYCYIFRPAKAEARS